MERRHPRGCKKPHSETAAAGVGGRFSDIQMTAEWPDGVYEQLNDNTAEMRKQKQLDSGRF